jgi:hypothetical protein
MKAINRRARRLVTGPDEWGSVYVYYGAPKAKSVHKTVDLDCEIKADYDKRGRLIGIELLGVPWKLK